MIIYSYSNTSTRRTHSRLASGRCTPFSAVYHRPSKIKPRCCHQVVNARAQISEDCYYARSTLKRFEAMPIRICSTRCNPKHPWSQLVVPHARNAVVSLNGLVRFGPSSNGTSARSVAHHASLALSPASCNRCQPASQDQPCSGPLSLMSSFAAEATMRRIVPFCQVLLAFEPDLHLDACVNAVHKSRLHTNAIGILTSLSCLGRLSLLVKTAASPTNAPLPTPTAAILDLPRKQLQQQL